MASIFMEAAVRLPRLTISGLMALVLLVALDVWVGRALVMDLRPSGTYLAELADLVVFGALPMANVLSIGFYLIMRSRHEDERNRPGPGLVGFEVGGLAALLVFLAGSLILAHSLHEGVGLVVRAIGPVPPGPVFLTAAVIVLLVPQLALALLGARLGRTYRIRVSVTVERRTIPDPEPGTTPEHFVGEVI
jgi:hypothetical protein